MGSGIGNQVGNRLPVATAPTAPTPAKINTSQNKLRDSLRRLRQPPQSPQSQPAAPSQE